MTGNLKPVRIQRRRVKGFNLDAESRKVNGLPVKYVGRRSLWGNPYKIGSYTNRIFGGTFQVTEENCLRRYEYALRIKLDEYPGFLKPLRGYNLACWCPLTDKDGKPVPCHAEILLKLIREKYGE
jgi:hypothetical protein